jgi:NADH-quinone oxidoreductase subunit E
MIRDELIEELRRAVARTEHPRELVVDVMYALQRSCGSMTDEAVERCAELLGMTPLEVEELATFYDFIYREPVGTYVLHVCDGVVCWMEGSDTVKSYLERKLGVAAGETTADGLFTILPVACIGFCDRAPAMLVNGACHGDLTPARIDALLEELRRLPPRVICP